ncbi:unnamed protein product [Pleuronectes platessa]|uniref:Uncharacterized protein n=1 Tax=Pleuronectes platessa TaxID=8262 RepID=A0A9N7UGJ6_PLEPL|nr:unnamed protein product [Pleuronectes platessa]
MELFAFPCSLRDDTQLEEKPKASAVIQDVLECDGVFPEKGCQGADKRVNGASSELRLESRALIDPYMMNTMKDMPKPSPGCAERAASPLGSGACGDNEAASGSSQAAPPSTDQSFALIQVKNGLVLSTL